MSRARTVDADPRRGRRGVWGRDDEVRARVWVSEHAAYCTFFLRKGTGGCGLGFANGSCTSLPYLTYPTYLGAWVCSRCPLALLH